MTAIASIGFTDADSGDEALLTVRVEAEFVGLGISLQDDGDIEVFLGASEVDKLLEALRKARSEIS